jgi:alpha-aminoadipic semialdehyde synthase
MEGHKNVIGLRRESKNYWERRVGLTPVHVSMLTKLGIKILVQPSTTRCFSDIEFEKAGAEISEDLSEAQLIIGIKEVPVSDLLPNRTYMFFSHTLKAQPYNMPLLDALIDKNIRLIDYECIKNDEGRLVAFGTFAGNAGVIDFLQGLGKFLLMRKINNPFLYERFSYMYYTLSEALESVKIIGKIISTEGLPTGLEPMIWGITGTGRCSEGALQVLKNFPHKIITPEDLNNFNLSDEDKRQIYIVIFGTNHMYARISDGEFDRNEFRSSPHLYKSVFKEKYAGKLSIIVNCIYYENKYPKLLRTEDFVDGVGKLIGICDVSCDLRGGIEICRKFTTPEEPFFLYKPQEDRIYKLAQENAENSILYHSMDFLPSELPRDASQHFSNKIFDYVIELAKDDASVPYEALSISDEIKNAMMTCHGKLTPLYEYIIDLRKIKERDTVTQNTYSISQEIADVVSKCPELVSDLQNACFYQEISEESKEAIIKLAELLQSNMIG